MTNTSFKNKSLITLECTQPKTSRPEWGYKPPIFTPLSPRIRNAAIVNSLKKDLSLRLESPKINVRPPITKSRNTIQPRFRNLNRATKVHHRDFSQESKDALQDFNNVPDDTKKVKKVLFELKDQVQIEIENSNYKEAAHIQKTIEKAEKKLSDLQNINSDIFTIQEGLSKHCDLEAIVSLRLEEWDRKYSEFLELVEKREKELREQFEEEIREYDKNVPVEPDRMYVKQSLLLMNLREQERIFARQHKFSLAEKQKEVANQHETSEFKVAMQKTMTNFRRNRELLVKRFEQRLAAFHQHVHSTDIALKRARAKAIEGYLNRMSTIDNNVGLLCKKYNIKAEDIFDTEAQQKRDQEVIEYERSVHLRSGVPMFTQGSAFMNTLKPKPSRGVSELESNEQTIRSDERSDHHDEPAELPPLKEEEEDVEEQEVAGGENLFKATQYEERTDDFEDKLLNDVPHEVDIKDSEYGDENNQEQNFMDQEEVQVDASLPDAIEHDS